MEQYLDDKTPLVMLTVAQFRELQKECAPQVQQTKQKQPVEFVYGLRGIRELFGVCHSTAQKLKHGVLAPAVKQHGRKLIVDRYKAIELFNQNKEGK